MTGFLDCHRHGFPRRRNTKTLTGILLPDNGEIKFTHADLHRGHIIISACNPARVVAIVDWAQAG